MMVSVTSVHNQKQKNSHSQREELQPCQSLHHHHYTSLLSFLLFLLFLASCTAGAHAQRRFTQGPRTYPLLAAIPDSAFRCDGRNAGYYADIETGCQVYHMCDTLEKQFSYLCPNHTLFNQKFMVCDHWYMVNCTMADSFYDLNDHIGEVPDKGANTIDGGNNQNVRKSSTFTQKPQGVHQFKAIVPVSVKKFQSTTKPTQVPSSRPTLLSANVPVASQSSFFTVPNNPFTIKTTSKATNRPQTSLFTTRRPLNPFSNSVFTKSPFTSATTTKPARAFVFNHNTLTSATTSKPDRASVFNHNTFTSSTTPKPARASVFNRNTFSSSITPKPARASVFNRNTLTSASTPKPARASIFNHNTLTTTISNPARISVFNRNTLTTTTRPITVATNKPFTSRFPGNVARSPGGSFSFAQMKLHNLTITRQQLGGLVFRPLVANPFAIKNRSSIPSFAFSSTSRPLNSNLKGHPLVTTPHSLEDLDSDEEEDQTSQHSTQQVLAAPLRALGSPSQPFGIPVPSRLLVPPPFNIFTNNHIPVPITTVIEPPTARRKGTSPIKLSQSVITNPQVVRTNPGQETPLTPFTKKPPKFRPFGTSEEVIPGVLHISFQSARGNRDFFIPSSGLSLPEEVLPAPPNSLSNTQDNNDHDHEDNVPHTQHGSTFNTGDFHMTMLFPGSAGTPVISALALNPQCPHCHPAFLQPGQCTPCVRIRR